MQVQGNMVIGRQMKLGQAGMIRAVNPTRNIEIEPAFGLASQDDIDRACTLAQAAFDAYRNTSAVQRARFLEAIADGIMNLGASLIERAQQETGLPQARLEGERGRTMHQLRLFAQVLRDGHYLSASLDSALPERNPPRPDLRLRKIAVGPVAVFGASNFPLAFSVAGGDTASALAAGCPVVVKAHNAHLGTSELVAKVIQAAALECDLPEGVFSMLIGDGRQIGIKLVSHAGIKAVGFTGSRQGGMALMHAAAQRPEPIPVYAEMSSINPVFLLPHAMSESASRIATQFVDSLTLGSGQFCTNPGLIIALSNQNLEPFLATVSQILNDKVATTMLTPAIHLAYGQGVQKLWAQPGIELIAQGRSGTTACAAQAYLFTCTAAEFLSHPSFSEEIFGPASVLVRCDSFDDMLAIAEHLEGQLTTTIHANASDYLWASRLLPILERKAGRILFNGFPTGVEVAHAMVHGGPFPSTSDSRSTSVGATAIDRFLRPVCYQNFPAELLPSCLSDDNPLGIPRLVDGSYEA